jgi:hypothetical protein
MYYNLTIKDMKEYLLLFWNESGERQYQIDPEKMKDGMAAWQTWIGNIAMNGGLISTKPINWDGAIVAHHMVHEHPTILEKKMVTGYMLCKAASMAEMKEWAKTCPILANPNGFTEIREVSPFEM